MPVNTPFIGYNSAVKLTTKARDFDRGDEAIKAKGQLYLSKLADQSDQSYQSYKSRAQVYPLVRPTKLAVRGAITRKEPQFDSQLSIDVDQLSQRIIDELLLAGVVGGLVEYNDTTKRSEIKLYKRESIINLDPIVLQQCYTVRDKMDRFKVEDRVEYLELALENGVYTQRIWREEGKAFKVVEEITPTNRGSALNYIPFYLCGDIKSDPILLDLANVSLSQYRLSADHRHGLHWSALPTLFIFGDLGDTQIRVGSECANNLPDTEGRAEMVEFRGQGIGAIREAIKDDLDVAASIGAKLFSSVTAGVRSAETARIEAGSESATLTVIADLVDEFMNLILTAAAEWQGVAPAEFTINRDFIDAEVDHNLLMTLLKALMAGYITQDVFLNQLEKNELLPAGKTALDIIDELS